MNSTIIKTTNSQFEEQVLKSRVPVLVDFWATWCGPCRAQNPILEELAGAFEGKLTIAKVNVDEEPALAEQYGVTSIPTLMIFIKGEPVETLVGVRSKDELAKYFQTRSH